MKAVDVAKKFGVTRQTVSNWVNKGLLKSIKLDGCHYVTIASVKAVENKCPNIVPEEDLLIEYQNNLRELNDDYRKTIENLKEDIEGNRFLLKTRTIASRLISEIYILLKGSVDYGRCDLITKSLIGGNDIVSVSRDFNLTPTRITQIVEKHLTKLRLSMQDYDTLNKENKELREKVKALEINIKGYGNLTVEKKKLDVQSCILNSRLEDFNISARSLHCCYENNIFTIGELVSLQKTDLLKLRNFGRKSLSEIMDFVEKLGLELGKTYMVDDKGDVVIVENKK